MKFSKSKKPVGLGIGLVLILLSIPVLGLQDDWVSLFRDDFDEGSAESWDLEQGWGIVADDSGGFALRGASPSWARLPESSAWSNYRFKSRIKLSGGAIHLNCRLSASGRYFIGFSSEGLYLSKQFWPDLFFDLASHNEAFARDTWHTVEIVCDGAVIKVSVNGDLKIEYRDEAGPLVGGGISFENLEEAEVYIDDVEIVGKPLPQAPPGYDWEATGGPSGGLGYDIRIHPLDKNIMFVTDNPSGVNKSYDAGRTWVKRNEGIDARVGFSQDGIPVFSLTIDPNDPDIVWSGTQDAKGIFKSTDGGETWVRKDDGVVEGNEISFRGFAIRPGDSDVVIAGAEIVTREQGIEFDKTRGKIYKTVDGGENWYSVWEGDNLARVVLFDPKEPDVVYCSTGIFDREAFDSSEELGEPGGVGILKSVDGGETWFAINEGLDNLYVGFLEMHPTDSQILFAAAHNNAYGYAPNNLPGGVFRTTDGGETWQRKLSGESFTVVTFSRSDPNVVYAGGQHAFHRSEDGGETWQRYNKEEDNTWGPPSIIAGFPISAVVDPDDPMKVYVNNYGGGNFVSLDGGKAWQNSSKGYSGAQMRDIAVDPQNPGKVYAVGRSGPFVSYDAGEKWSGMANGTGVGGYTICAFPDNPSEILGADDASRSLVKSTDSGRSWREVYRFHTAGTIVERRHGFVAIAIAPSSPDVVYAGMRKASNVGAIDPSVDPSFGLFKSTDRGENWTEVNTGLEASSKAINVIAVHPDNPDIAYAGTFHDGVFKTLDGGGSWELHNNGLGSVNIRSLAIDPQNPDILYAGTGNGVGLFKSTNGGELWRDINDGVQLECPSDLSPAGKGLEGIRLEMSRKSLNTDYYRVPWTKVMDIVIDPANPQTLYAADLNSGAYLSTDGGCSWVLIDEGLSVRAITCMAISADGQTLYAGTEGGGVYRLFPGEGSGPPPVVEEPSGEVSTGLPGDFSGDGQVDFEDFFLFADAFGGADPAYDLDSSGQVDFADFFLFADSFGKEGREKLMDLAREYIGLPTAVHLEQNYPNPFNSSTTIRYLVSQRSWVQLEVFDLMGQRIKSLVRRRQEPGSYEIVWKGEGERGSAVSTGIYFARLQVDNSTEVKKMVLVQ